MKIKQNNYKKRDARLVVEAAAWLVPPLLALKDGDNKTARLVLTDLLNRATLVLINADKNDLKAQKLQLWYINDCRTKLNCKFKDELVEQKAAEFFKDFEQIERTANSHCRILRTYHQPVNNSRKSE